MDKAVFFLREAEFILGLYFSLFAVVIEEAYPLFPFFKNMHFVEPLWASNCINFQLGNIYGLKPNS